MKKIKIAQIGTSRYSHGTSVWKSLLKQSDLFDVVGYAFPENEQKKFPEQAKSFDGYRKMTMDEILNDPEIEAVAVETEEIYLTKYALMVAKSGKHLHMEKTRWHGFFRFQTTDCTFTIEKTRVFNGIYVSLQSENPGSLEKSRKRRAWKNLRRGSAYEL